MGRHDLALPLYRDALRRSRRVLGNRHPGTLVIMADLGESLCRGTDRGAGIALLEEAVAGDIAVLGAEHPQTRSARADLTLAENEESEEQQEQQQEDETVADRIRKRRRRT